MASNAGPSCAIDRVGKQVLGRARVSACGEHPSEVAAVMAFSPGEYLGDTHAVKDPAATVRAPVFITCARNAEGIAATHVLAGRSTRLVRCSFRAETWGSRFFDTRMGQECRRRRR